MRDSTPLYSAAVQAMSLILLMDEERYLAKPQGTLARDLPTKASIQTVYVLPDQAPSRASLASTEL